MGIGFTYLLMFTLYARQSIEIRGKILNLKPWNALHRLTSWQWMLWYMENNGRVSLFACLVCSSWISKQSACYLSVDAL
jgi:hypothetical protein